MKRLLPIPALFSAVLLCACSNEPAHLDGPGPDAAATGGAAGMGALPASAQAEAALDHPVEDVPPATAPPGTVMPEPRPAEDNAEGAGFNGYGDILFGTDLDRVRELWDGELEGDAAGDEACFQLFPAGQTMSELALMFVDGRFVRYSSESTSAVAPGGARPGMSLDEVKTLYGDGVQPVPHKYVEGAWYLRVPSAEGEGVLVLETDAEDTVVGWRVGVPPAVDYVEGCG